VQNTVSRSRKLNFLKEEAPIKAAIYDVKMRRLVEMRIFDSGLLIRRRRLEVGACGNEGIQRDFIPLEIPFVHDLGMILEPL
jgi:hypothetical protein